MPRKKAKRKAAPLQPPPTTAEGEMAAGSGADADGDGDTEMMDEEDTPKLSSTSRMADPPIVNVIIDASAQPNAPATATPAAATTTSSQVYPVGALGLGGFDFNSLDYARQRVAPGRPDMDQGWSSSGYYGYFGNDSATRASERGGAAGSSTSPNEEDSSQLQQQQQQQRRSGHPNQYLPPPPHSTSPHNMNLPPFQQTFYQSAYHSPTGQHPSMGGQMHHLPQQGSGGYGNQNQHMMPPPPGGNPYPYPVASPAMSAPPLPGGRQPPPHSYTESPRMPGAGGYSSSPGFHHLSPTSPTTHLIPPGIQASSASASSSSYQSARTGMGGLMRDNGSGTSNKRRGGSEGGVSGDGDSWDEGESGGKHGDSEQPWGMPQEEYKALNPRDKKQVRNRIGARRFRAKRKDYVSNLEHTLKERDDECSSLRTQVESHRNEINDLRHRLGMPLLPPPPQPPQTQSSGDSGALGLVVPGGSDWDKND